MSLTSNNFVALAERVQRGEPGAAAELRQLLEGSLGPIVRRALRGGSAALLDQSIREAARREPRRQPAGRSCRRGRIILIGADRRPAAGRRRFRRCRKTDCCGVRHCNPLG